MKIYVDGACKTSTKVGGWAVVITKDDEKNNNRNSFTNWNYISDSWH